MKLSTPRRLFRVFSVLCRSWRFHKENTSIGRLAIAPNGVYTQITIQLSGPKRKPAFLCSAYLALAKNAEQSNISHGLGIRMRISNQSPDVDKPHTFRCRRSKLEATIDGTDVVEVGERVKSLVWVLPLSPLRFDYAVGLHRLLHNN